MQINLFNQTFVAAFIGNLIAFIAGASLTWSSPMLVKLNGTAADAGDELPFGRPLTGDEASWIGSLLALGATFGPFLSGWAAECYGRKTTLTALGAPFLLAYLILAFGDSVLYYYGARFLVGVAVGGVFTVMPMYVGEIARDENRGALGSVMNCFICAGLVVSYGLGPYVSIMVFNLILAIIPAVFMVLFYVLAPESPHYHLARGREDQAMVCLQSLRASTCEKELGEIKESIAKGGTKGTFFDLFKSRGLIKGLVIALALVSFQQFSGINAVLFYAETIFEAAGSTLKPEVCSIIIGSVQFVTSFVTPLFADRLGRKPLLYISSLGMMLALVPLGAYFYLKSTSTDVSAISWLPVVALVGYIVAYNSGFGPLPWALMGELFPNNVKSIASSLTAGFCWLLAFIITKCFQSMALALGMGPSFWLFAGFCAVAFIFTLLYVIETKGKSLQDIQDLLEGN